MKIAESGEMYLETILVLSRRLPRVRAVDVANETGYSKPSVSHALGILKNGGMLTVDDHGFIGLTEDGHSLAERTYERHTTLTGLLRLLGVSEATAEQDACKIEHVISSETFGQIKAYLALQSAEPGSAGKENK